MHSRTHLSTHSQAFSLCIHYTNIRDVFKDNVVNMAKAKAWGLRGQGQRSWVFIRTNNDPCNHHSQIQRSTAVLSLVRLWMKYCIYAIESLTYIQYSKLHRLTARSRSQSQGCASSRPWVFEVKAKATEFCPRGVLEVEASPRGPHPWHTLLWSIVSDGVTGRRTQQ